MNASKTENQQPLRTSIPLRAVSLLYRYLLSPILHGTQRSLTGTPGACRFQPTCSEYAALAWHTHGPIHGGGLALRRVLRCHPFARGGFDPVPTVKPSLDPGQRLPEEGLSHAAASENARPFTIGTKREGQTLRSDR